MGMGPVRERRRDWYGVDCTRYHDIDVNWRASFGAFVSLSLPIYSRYIRALSSHNSNSPEWQTLDTLDTRTWTRTRGLRCAILNGFIDTLRCRNNKQLSRQAGRLRRDGERLTCLQTLATTNAQQYFNCRRNEPIRALQKDRLPSAAPVRAWENVEFITRIICEFRF